jgi:hypothetical protein
MVAAGWAIRSTGKTGGSQPIMLLLTVRAINSVVMREQKRERRLLTVKTSAKSLTLGGEGVRHIFASSDATSIHESHFPL